MDDPSVIVAQGVRISTNPAFRVIDSYGNQRTDYPRESLDNNMGITALNTENRLQRSRNTS